MGILKSSSGLLFSATKYVHIILGQKNKYVYWPQNNSILIFIGVVELDKNLT